MDVTIALPDANQAGYNANYDNGLDSRTDVKGHSSGKLYRLIGDGVYQGADSFNRGLECISGLEWADPCRRSGK